MAFSTHKFYFYRTFFVFFFIKCPSYYITHEFLFFYMSSHLLRRHTNASENEYFTLFTALFISFDFFFQTSYLYPNALYQLLFAHHREIIQSFKLSFCSKIPIQSWKYNIEYKLLKYLSYTINYVIYPIAWIHFYGRGIRDTTSHRRTKSTIYIFYISTK